MKIATRIIALVCLVPFCWASLAQKVTQQASEKKDTKVLITAKEDADGKIVWSMLSGKEANEALERMETAKQFKLGDGRSRVFVRTGEDGRKEIIVRIEGDESEWSGLRSMFREMEVDVVELDAIGGHADEIEIDVVADQPRRRLATVLRSLTDEAPYHNIRQYYGEGPLLIASGRYGTPEQRKELAVQEAAARKLANRVRSADGEKQEALEADLTAQLEDIFALKQAMRMHEIESLQERFDKALQDREEREANRSAIIERRLNQLLGRSSKYDW